MKIGPLGGTWEDSLEVCGHFLRRLVRLDLFADIESGQLGFRKIMGRLL